MIERESLIGARKKAPLQKAEPNSSWGPGQARTVPPAIASFAVRAAQKAE